jgi:hypothetical protein
MLSIAHGYQLATLRTVLGFSLWSSSLLTWQRRQQSRLLSCRRHLQLEFLHQVVWTSKIAKKHYGLAGLLVLYAQAAQHKHFTRRLCKTARPRQVRGDFQRRHSSYPGLDREKKSRRRAGSMTIKKILTFVNRECRTGYHSLCAVRWQGLGFEVVCICTCHSAMKEGAASA